MRDAGVEKAILVGHSMGTPVALTFLRLHPERVAGLVIVDGFIPQPPKNDAERQKQLAQSDEMTKTYRSPEYRAAMERMLNFMFTDQTPAALRDQIRSTMLAAPQYVLASAMEGMMALDPPAPDTRFDVPAMALMVKRDSGPGYEAYLRSLFPRLWAYQAWEGAGHFLMMEQPERFNAALIAFLDRDRK
jgi:pimeloyl-ACP methyl ester carboxylesterase